MSDPIFTERLGKVIERLGGLSKASEATGINRSLLARYRSGQSEPTRSPLKRLSDASHVDLGWLTGQMRSEIMVHNIALCRTKNYTPSDAPIQPEIIGSISLDDQLLPLSTPLLGDISSSELLAFSLGTETLVTKTLPELDKDGSYLLLFGDRIVYREVNRTSEGFHLHVADTSEHIPFHKKLPFVGKVIWKGSPLIG